MDDANIIEYYLWSVEYLVCNNNLSFSREQVVSSLSWMGSVFSFCFLPDTKLKWNNYNCEQRRSLPVNIASKIAGRGCKYKCWWR